MKKSNKEKNQAHDARQQERVRPKQPNYNFKPLEDVIRAWKARANEQA